MFNIEIPNNTIQLFRNKFSSRGFQSANRYLVTFKRNSLSGANVDVAQKISYPESVILPEKQIEILKDSGYTTGRDLPISSSQGLVMLSFITMKDWQERKYFEKWMDSVAYGGRTLNGTGRTAVVLPYNESSNASMNISFYNENVTNVKTCNYSFYEVYPQAISPTSFESTSTGYASFQVIMHARSANFSSSI